MKRPGFFILSVVFLFACEKAGIDDCFKSTGSQVEVVRIVDWFNQIELNDNVNLEISQGEQKVTVKGGENLLELVTTEVSNGKLIINNYNVCNWLRDLSNRITVSIQVENIEYIYWFGQGDIVTTEQLQLNSLTVDAKNSDGDLHLNLLCDSLVVLFESGASDLYVVGESDYFFFYVTGSGFGFCDDFFVDSVHVHSRTNGDIYVHSALYLNAELRNSGDIYYYGNPEIKVEYEGSGQLIHLE